MLLKFHEESVPGLLIPGLARHVADEGELQGGAGSSGKSDSLDRVSQAFLLPEGTGAKYFEWFAVLDHSLLTRERGNVYAQRVNHHLVGRAAELLKMLGH